MDDDDVIGIGFAFGRGVGRSFHRGLRARRTQAPRALHRDALTKRVEHGEVKIGQQRGVVG